MYRAITTRVIINLLLPLLIYSCSSDNRDESRAQIIPSGSNFEVPKGMDQLAIDLNKSVVEWKGTKLLGTGSHSGTVKFKSGFLTFENDQLKGGRFLVDMTSIFNTDIPMSDPVPRENLTNHLNNDFEISSFPEADFIITAVSPVDHEIEITGDLTIKGVTHQIVLDARLLNDSTYVSEFSFDRFSWKIGEDGSWLEKKLVDPYILLKVTIVLTDQSGA